MNGEIPFYLMVAMVFTVYTRLVPIEVSVCRIMPKQDHSVEHSLNTKIAQLKRECQQLRAEREYMQVRVTDVCREIEALVQYYSATKPPKPLAESDTSGSPSPDTARRTSISLISLDQMREGSSDRQEFSRSSLSIDDATHKESEGAVRHEMGPPSCPPLIRSLQASPNARSYRRRVAVMDEVERLRASSYLKAESARDRSNSQQSLPDTISKDTQAKGFLVRTKSGDVRVSAKMSLSSSSPALATRDFSGHLLPPGSREGERKESLGGATAQMASKTCTDL